MKNIKTGKLFLGLVCIIWILTIIIPFTGCYSVKKAVKQSIHAIDKHPIEVLHIFRDSFPCVTTKADTTIISKDTTIWVDCPDTATAAQYFTLHDTVFKQIQLPGKTIRVPVTLPVKTVTVVKEIEDLSRVTQMSLERDAAIKERDFYHHKSDKRGKTNVWLIFLVVGLLTPYIIRAIKFVSLKSVIK